MRVGCILLAIFLFCAFALLPQPVQGANTVTATVPVGSEPTGVAVTPRGAFAYVTNFGSNPVSVIRTATTAIPSPAIPEFPAQLLIITLVVFMITGLSAVIIAKKRITRAEKVHGILLNWNFFGKHILFPFGSFRQTLAEPIMRAFSRDA